MFKHHGSSGSNTHSDISLWHAECHKLVEQWERPTNAVRNSIMQSINNVGMACHAVKKIQVFGLGSLEQHCKLDDMFKWDNPEWPMFQVILTQLILVIDIRHALQSLSDVTDVLTCAQDPEFEEEDMDFLRSIHVHPQQEGLEAKMDSKSMVVLPTLAPEALTEDFITHFEGSEAPAMLLTDLMRDGKIFEEESQEKAFRVDVQQHYRKSDLAIEVDWRLSDYAIFQPLADLELWVRNDL